MRQHCNDLGSTPVFTQDVADLPQRLDLRCVRQPAPRKAGPTALSGAGAMQAMINDERKALERAQATLDTLTPATARDDAIVFDCATLRGS